MEYFFGLNLDWTRLSPWPPACIVYEGGFKSREVWFRFDARVKLLIRSNG